MKYFRSRKQVSVDYAHMKALHEECVEQLELLCNSLRAAQCANGSMRDRLREMADAHWSAYIEIVHLIAMHDPQMQQALGKSSLDLRGEEDASEKETRPRCALLEQLIALLLRRHRRVLYIYRTGGEPMQDYLEESAIIERTYIAALVEMTHMTLQS